MLRIFEAHFRQKVKNTEPFSYKKSVYLARWKFGSTLSVTNDTAEKGSKESNIH